MTPTEMETVLRKVDGAPGTGKTTLLFNSIKERAANGCSAGDIFVVTFTRSARADAIRELKDVFPELPTKDVKKRVRTFHGAALTSCYNAGIIREIDDQLIIQESTPEIYEEFAHTQYLSYHPEKTPDWEELRSGRGIDMPYGNRIFKISNWLALTQRPPEDYPKAPVGIGMDYDRVVEILYAWDEFKQAGTEIVTDDDEVIEVPYFEHPDYVDAAIKSELVPNCRYLYVDEFQDLSPQEYKLFKIWRKNGEYDEIIVAGDPEQSIYGFREATSYFFEEMPVDDVILRKESYRTPDRVAAVARGILDGHSETDPRGFRAKEPGGVATSVSLRDDDALRGAVSSAIDRHVGMGSEKPAIFLLARANHQVSSIVSALRAGGIPYRKLGAKRQPWNATVTHLYNALWALQENRHATARAVKELLKKLPDGEERERRLFGGKALWDQIDLSDPFDPADLREAFPETATDIAKHITDVSARRRKLLIDVFDRDAGATHSPSDVRVGTIHSAKGLEARCVFLFDAITARTEDAYYNSPRNAAEEHRLFYVAATRASESLYVVRDYANGPVFPGFRGQIPTTQPSKDLEDTGGETA